MSSPSKEDSAFSSPRSEDEHMMYDNLESPTFETVEGVDGAVSEQPQALQNPEEREREMEEYRRSLEIVEGEIATLRQVLGSKVRYASELKRKMGITPFQELKQDLHYGFKTIKESDTVVKTNEKLTNVKERITASNAYQKTSSAVKTASEKTNAAVSSFGASVTKKLGDLRNSNTFKSVEEKVGGAYSNVKAKVTGSKSEGSFEDALQSERAKEGGANGTAVPEANSLPEEKVPL
ncbi:tumor protein D54-like isoform X6 [Mizuhopecten yessoensis]|uniref:tumor protein D54-like isoform X6 n=1 Tax=Mizuhopecten yessoensis TaxID=6573 RepID=UPI000B45B762|nr:tumor protein D54-like isoform X6 [Mizuhopecten yessoensis]